MRTRFLATIVSAICSSSVLAGNIELKMGPAGVGAGGTNPLGIPPGAADLQLDYLTDSHFQTSFSVVPGLLFGQRFYNDTFFGSIGGGLVISANGIGGGPYASLGYHKRSKSGFGLVAEYRQAFGIGPELIFPYALRIGASYAF